MATPPALRHQRETDQLEQGALAAAAGADHRDELAGADVKIEIAQDLLVAEALGDALDADFDALAGAHQRRLGAEVREGEDGPRAGHAAALA